MFKVFIIFTISLTVYFQTTMNTNLRCYASGIHNRDENQKLPVVVLVHKNFIESCVIALLFRSIA